jgi:hypothetical protein
MTFRHDIDPKKEMSIVISLDSMGKGSQIKRRKG